MLTQTETINSPYSSLEIPSALFMDDVTHPQNT